MSQYFAYVQRPGEQLFRQAVSVFSRPGGTVDGRYQPDEYYAVRPDANGVFTLDERHPHFDDAMRAMKDKQQRENAKGQPKRLVGPFAEYSEALKQAVLNRPKTPEEENAVLKSKLAEAEAKLAEKPEPRQKPTKEG